MFSKTVIMFVIGTKTYTVMCSPVFLRMTGSIYILLVCWEKQKVQIPFSDVVRKRKTKKKAPIPFSNLLIRKLLGYSHANIKFQEAPAICTGLGRRSRRPVQSLSMWISKETLMAWMANEEVPLPSRVCSSHAGWKKSRWAKRACGGRMRGK